MKNDQNLNHNMQDYYNQRAPSLENVYNRDEPERNEELARIRKFLIDELGGRTVYEIACGTGYWTATIARVCPKILAIDGSAEMLALAREKQYPPDIVEFLQGDAFNLPPVQTPFQAGLAAFWFSHIELARVREFLEGFHQQISSGGKIIIFENCFRDNPDGALVKDEITGNTYRIRTLPDESQHQIIKNYYSEEKLREILSEYSQKIKIDVGKYYWRTIYELP